MAMSTRAVRYGPEAALALSDEIAEGQRDDPLAPVTVVVTQPTVGLALRRLLASGQVERPAPRRTSVVNVRFLTLARLADELGAPALTATGRQPASRAVRQAAVRAELDAVTGGPFFPVRHHPSTERGLASVLRDLQGTDADTRQRLAATSERAAEVIRLAEGVRARLHEWYDEHDAIESAVAAVRLDPGGLGRRPGRIVVHLPFTLTTDGRALLDALAGTTDVVMLVGATGDEAADQGARELAAPRRAGAGEPTFPIGEVPRATAVVSAPSADTEVLLALRGVMQRQRDGIPLERMSVVHGGTDPYPRLLHESFSLAGIPTNGPGVRPLSATMVGRTLLGALALPDHDWRRDEVLAWLSGAPIRHDRTPVPATAWDDVSRRAGITSGRASWSEHLDHLAADLRHELEVELGDDTGGADEPEPRRLRLERRLGWVQSLDAFVQELSARLEPDPAIATWRGWTRWAERFLRDYVGDASSWPVDEQQALVEIGDRLGRLSILDAVDPAPDIGRFRRALESDLSAPAPRTSRFGQGVLVGPIDAIVGLDLDVVFVVGMTEGAFPARARDDALLPDDERVTGGADVPLRSVRPADAHRAYLAALASARERVLSFSRGDQRRGREQRPSRWLLDSLGALAGGRRLFSRDLADLDGVKGFERVPSLTAAVASPLEPASLPDRDLQSLLWWFDRHGRLDGHPLTRSDPVLRLGLLARHDRRQAAFTRFDGRVDRVVTPSPVERRALAPTSLEQYAVCPRRYFLGKVLWIDVAERPEDVQRISPIDKGNLVHRVLERFIDEHVERPRPERIRPHQPWSPADHARLDQIADEAFADYEQLGLTGRVLLWELDRDTIRRDLHTFLHYDDRYRARMGVVPERAELRFGLGDETPVEVRLRDQRQLRFKGSADRVDLTDDGSAVVLDYKTGRHDGFRLVEGADPTVRGTKLQLPIYGLAARSRFGPVDVQADYWFLTERSQFAQIGYPLDDERVERFHDVVEVIVDGIESGQFPANPGDEDLYRDSYKNCHHCEFDSVCPRDRGREWERVRGTEELGRYVALAEGTPPVTTPDGGGAPR
jgi:ATP-dependent helicase/nuclease subunit B